MLRTITFVTKPPCTANPELFTNPTTETAHHAVTLCQTCPLLRSCATDAITSGTTLDHGLRAPAADVIQAGVWCTGDQETANRLAEVAGITAPTYGPKPRYTPPTRCKGCHTEMVTRIKGQPTTPDVLTHGAHGYCRICDARRRRTKGWHTPTPKHSTIFDWKETHGTRLRSSNSGPGRTRTNGQRPANRPS